MMQKLCAVEDTNNDYAYNRKVHQIIRHENNVCHFK